MSTIGPYRLVSSLGEGGMSTVWRAQHQTTGAMVALKTVLLPKRSFLRNIRREIQTLAGLHHPGIIRIVDEGLHDGLPWYAMELLDGQTLQRWLRGQHPPSADELATIARDTPLPTSLSADELATIARDTPSPNFSQVVTTVGAQEHSQPTHPPTLHKVSERAPSSPPSQRTLNEILRMIHRLCAPLAFLHGEGLVHRDLKPANILIRADGSPVLVDFGLTSQEGYGGDSSREKLVVESGLAGTAYYMSPEQIEQEPLDARADLYALGVILYEALTGQPPFTGQTLTSIFWGHLHKEPAPPSALLPSLPKELDILVLGLLRKKREERRPGYAVDLERALLEIGRKEALFYPLANEGNLQAPPPHPYLYRPHLFGRAEPMAKLQEIAVRANQEAGGIVLLGGESGVGKTRLAMEFAKKAARKGMRVLTGESQDRGAKLPLGSLRNPLREIGDAAREKGEKESERLFGKRGKVLSRYEPSLAFLSRQERHPEPAELSLKAARFRLFSYLRETLLAFAEETPLLLILDDLQWADELSLGFLQFLLRSKSIPRGLLLLATYRSEEQSAELGALLAEPGVFALQLERLREEAVAQIVGEMLALSPPPKVFSHFLSKQSEGNPFFVAEYLRTAVEEGLLFRDETGQWQLVEVKTPTEEDYANLPLPKNLRALVSQRLAGLPQEARRLLEVVAVVGREAPRSCLESMLGVSASPPLISGDNQGGELLEAPLRELIRRQIVEETPEGSLRFVHDKLREVAYERLPVEMRPALHKRAALALLPLKDTKNGELGYHWEQAKEPSKARPFYLAGARKAAQAYSHKEAETLYRAYLRHCDTPTPESVTARNELGVKILQVQGRMEEATKEYQQAILEARRLEARELEAESLRFLGTVHKQTGRLDEAKELYAKALLLTREVGNRRAEGACLGNLANLYLEQGWLEKAKECYTQALALLRELGDRRAESVCLANLAGLCHEQGRLDEAKELYAKALLLAREVGERRFEGVFLGYLAGPHYEQGNIEEAKELLTEALAIVREVGDRRYEGALLGERARLELWSTGDPQKVEALLKKGETLSLAVGDKMEEGKLLCGRGHLALLKEQSAESFLLRVRELVRTLQVKPESELAKRLTQLERTQAAFVALETHRLFRGYLLKDIPSPLRAWLMQTGQLPQTALDS